MKGLDCDVIVRVLQLTSSAMQNCCALGRQQRVAQDLARKRAVQ